MKTSSPIQLKENRQHSSTLVPFSLYQCRIPEFYAGVPMHWHREFEINYILEGEGQFILGEERYIASAGDIVIIPPNILHAAYAVEGNILVYDALVFNHSILGTGSNDRSTAECILPIISGQLKIAMLISAQKGIQKEDAVSGRLALNNEDQNFRDCVERIFESAKDNNSLSDLLLKSELLRFFWLLEKKTQPMIRKEETDIHYSELIRPALEYMALHYGEDITVEKLSDISHLSKSYFMGCFKKATGIGAIEHLTQIRMKIICDALIHSNDHIADLAYSCGYDNLSNFNRQFKRMIGCTPMEYRHRNR